MRINKLAIKNIRSYEDAEIEFPEGILLLSGDVGSGKTSILLALEYALFGLQPGQKGSALLRHNKDFGEVLLEFEVDGHEVIIERKLKRTSKSISNDYAAITIDGVKEESSVTEVKTKVLKILNYPFEFVKKNNLLYRFTVYTPQEEMKQIILEDAESRLNILRHVFGIDKYKRIRENLLILTAKLKEEAKMIQVEIKELDNEKARLEAIKSSTLFLDEKIKEKEKELIISVQKRKAIELESQELEKKIKEREKFEKEIAKTNIMIAYKKDQLSNSGRDITETESKMSNIKESFKEEELKEVTKKINEKKSGVDELNKSYFDLISQINSLNLKREESLDRKSRIYAIDICPTCLQNVPGHHKHNIMNKTENEILEIGRKILEFESKKQEKMALIEREKLLLTDLEDTKVRLEIMQAKAKDVESSKAKLFDLIKFKESLQRDISLLVKHIDSLKESVLAYSKFYTLFKIKQDELKKAFVAEKNVEIKAAELKKELELVRKEIFRLETEVAIKENSKKKLLDLSEVSDWLANQFTNLIDFTERNIMMKLRQEFSKLFSKWFYTLTQDTFEVHLDENFTPIIMQQGYEMDYAFLSGGERTAVALAYRLALNQTINSILSKIKTKDLVILDEPTDGFSEQQLDKIRDVIEELNVSQLILVSHEQKIESFVDHVLKLKKTNGISAKES